MKYFFVFIFAFLFTSCTKKNYTITVDGFIYKDCNLDPEVGYKIRLFNNQLDYYNEVNTKTDSNGYFNLILNGEGPTEIFIEIGAMYTGPISSCRINAINKDSANVILNKGLVNIDDTLYVSFHALDPSGNYAYNRNVIFKLTEDNFNPNHILKINRRYLLLDVIDLTANLDKLWISNNLGVYVVWGNGVKEYNESRNLLNSLKFESSSKIKKIQLKSCLNSEPINL